MNVQEKKKNQTHQHTHQHYLSNQICSDFKNPCGEIGSLQQ